MARDIEIVALLLLQKIKAHIMQNNAKHQHLVSAIKDTQIMATMTKQLILSCNWLSMAQRKEYLDHVDMLVAMDMLIYCKQMQNMQLDMVMLSILLH